MEKISNNIFTITSNCVDLQQLYVILEKKTRGFKRQDVSRFSFEFKMRDPGMIKPNLATEVHISSVFIPRKKSYFLQLEIENLVTNLSQCPRYI